MFEFGERERSVVVQVGFLQDVLELIHSIVFFYNLNFINLTDSLCLKDGVETNKRNQKIQTHRYQLVNVAIAEGVVVARQSLNHLLQVILPNHVIAIKI